MIEIEYTDLAKTETLEFISNFLKNEGILCYPTDTIYGIGGNFNSIKVLNSLDFIKSRSDMPYSVAVSGLEMLQPLISQLPENFLPIYQALFPGKFTFLLPAAGHIDRALLKQSDKIGIRVPDMPLLLKLIDFIQIPLFTTSINKSGDPPLNDPAAIRQFCRHYQSTDLEFLFINHGIIASNLGSTIIDFTLSPAKIIRPGEDSQKALDIINQYT
jgi:L-threonylcarbamoyladenylate synthase